MSHNSMLDRNGSLVEMEGILAREAAKRRTKTTEEWIIAERQAMFDAVNSKRTARDKTPLLITDIERVERQAVGHSDYTHKFALYCAMLVEE